MKPIVVVGSVNIDFSIRVAALPRPHETILGGDLTTAMGGKGLNQAAACARLGLETHLVAAVGADAFADQALEHLKARGVVTHHVHRLHGATGAASICVADDGANMIVVAPGANGHLRPRHIEQAEALIRDAAAVIVQMETPPETVKAALETARRHAVLSVLNPAPADARALVLAPLADLMTPNEIELERLTGVAGQGDAAVASCRPGQGVQRRARGHGEVVAVVPVPVDRPGHRAAEGRVGLGRPDRAAMGQPGQAVERA